jgi:hypothetical protein
LNGLNFPKYIEYFFQFEIILLAMFSKGGKQCLFTYLFLSLIYTRDCAKFSVVKGSEICLSDSTGKWCERGYKLTWLQMQV